MLIPTIYNMQKDFDDFFSEFDPILKRSGNNRLSPVFSDTYETDTHYIISMDVPGVDKKDIKITLEDKVLKIEGQKTFEHNTENIKNFFQKERFFGSFKRSFSIPNNINEQDVKTFYKNGVLQIAIPKEEKIQAKTIEVQSEEGSNFFQKLLGGKASKSES